MPAHEFGLGTIARCGCGVIRRRVRGGGWSYATDINGPYELEMPACEEPQAPNPWRERTIIMMDVETTGLDWTTDDITEIAFVVGKLHDFGPVYAGGDEAGNSDGQPWRRKYSWSVSEEFHSLVKPREHLFDRAKETAVITGIAVEELFGAPTFTEVSEAIIRLFNDAGEGALLAAYNAKFDQQFVAGALVRAGFDGRMPEALRSNKPLLDPCIWSRKVDRYMKGGHKLTTVAMRHGILTEADIAGAHRADFDARAAFDVLCHFAGELPERDYLNGMRRLPDDIDDLMDWQEAARGEWAANFFGKWLPGERRRKRREEQINGRV